MQLAVERVDKHSHELDEDDIRHTLVKHYWEEHGGHEPQVIIRITSSHAIAMDRQILEAVWIAHMLECSGKENLNAADQDPEPVATHKKEEMKGTKRIK